MRRKKNKEGAKGYISIFLRNARQEVDRILDELCESKEDTEDILFGRLSEAMQLLAKCWHLREISDEDFDALSHDDIVWLRHSIPDLALGSEPFRIVPKYAEIGHTETR
ncbi:MAG: hypothetical protein KDA20_07965 [Phycisphaerales bacterium]|nr:hypothetical protein [Phycisphaerales bacterium]